MAEPNLASYLASRRREIEGELRQRLAPAPGRPPGLVRAMRYAVLGPGKRLRPILTLAAAEVAGGAAARRRALAGGCAIELIHAYSLVHDDLPAMDDDDMRRGRPSVHRKFDEATAILVGDALLTEAFAILAASRLAPARALSIAHEIAQAAGVAGMVAGQVRDLESTGARNVGLRRVQEIHRQKTGALLRASLRVGVLAGGGDARLLRRLTSYGEDFGLLFQIADDILDEAADAKTLGKTPGGDRAVGKATYTALMGLDGARRELDRVAARALSTIAPLGRRGRWLDSLLRHVVDRAA